jgi:threonylcarbamoyladenosine tRNA methylthiotransferase MtaB
MNFFLTTLGCKVNQYETQVIREAWEGRGHSCVPEAAQAGVILIHSCAVTQKAVTDLRKSVAALHRAACETPILITGCAAEAHGAELSRLAGVTRVIGLADRECILRGPEALLMQKNGQSRARSHPHVLEGVQNFQRARAQVKIQDGCSHGCTYCIVPLARGPGQSRKPGAVLQEVQRLLAAGFREVNLIGINLRLYGQDLSYGMDFWDLIRMLDQAVSPEWSGRARFRLGSLDPAMLGEKAMCTIAGSRMLCPHLHLSLQSASLPVLRAMGRGHYRPRDVLDFCAELKRHLPLFSLGADLITGFPGEEDEHFQVTQNYCLRLPLSYAHVFPYSPRPGTVAAKRPDQVPEELRRERAKILRTLAEAKKKDFLQVLCGQAQVTMVVEGVRPVQGKCEYYVSCRLTAGPDRQLKDLLQVRPVGLSGKTVLCVPVPGVMPRTEP